MCGWWSHAVPTEQQSSGNSQGPQKGGTLPRPHSDSELGQSFIEDLPVHCWESGIVVTVGRGPAIIHHQHTCVHTRAPLSLALVTGKRAQWVRVHALESQTCVRIRAAELTCWVILAKTLPLPESLFALLRNGMVTAPASWGHWRSK